MRLCQSETIAQALQRMRSNPVEERIVYFYVVDEAGKLAGVVPTRKLLLSDPSTQISSIMVHPVVSVSESEEFGTSLQLLVSRRLFALPVVNEEGVLTGVVEISAFANSLADLERRATAEEVFQIVGVHVEQERSRSLRSALVGRFPWLILNIVSGMSAAAISHLFDGVLKAVVAVAFFIPLVLTLAEGVAMQTITMSIQTVQLSGSMPAKRWSGAREIRVGVLLGVLSGGAVGVLGIMWLHGTSVAAVVAIAILVATGVGSTLGYYVPRLIHHWKLDPKIASGPAVLALADVAALAFYLGLAALVLL
jgi:magnesium transporter